VYEYTSGRLWPDHTALERAHDSVGHERLLPPPTPRNITLREFGQRVMRWGSGDTAARARMSALIREELERAGLTREIAGAWRDFSRHESARNPNNPSATGRAELMQRAIELLDGGN